jgi:hypothetical protein
VVHLEPLDDAARASLVDGLVVGLRPSTACPPSRGRPDVMEKDRTIPRAAEHYDVSRAPAF